ncbi:MAG: peptidoglycan editing factor PgeF [Deltaproteobacteria bacterium]|nr:peptidoglycan editing factor PgeF [Deltaproteobacteria bacterium]
MVEKKVNLLTILFFENLLKYKEIRHFVSTRKGGVSKHPFDSLNLGLHVGDDPDNVLKNRKRLAATIGIPLRHFTIGEQIHSGNVTIISEELRGKGSTNHKEAINATDAMVTNAADICLVVLVADCVPILFFDPIKRAIGVAHAGWKGTLQFIAQKTVRAMEKAFGSSPQDIIVGAGPSIGPCCYKVGEDVISQVETIFHTRKECILNESKSGEGYFDLWKANLTQLLQAGIKRKNIEMARMCTCHKPDVFFSYRHQKGETGRFCAGITLL